MAGDWIKLELSTLDKPEVCEIAEYAGIDLDAVVGKLLRVWGWFDQQTENGNAPSVSKRLLDRLVGVNDFCDFMILVGWMVETEDESGYRTISLPNFDRHNGKTAKTRAQTAKRVASHKNTNAKGNACGVSETVESALPREEKRRYIYSTTSARDPRQRFAMTEDWQPDEVSLKPQLRMNGVAPETLTPEAIAEFVGYWLTNPDHEETHAGWCRKLVLSIHAAKTRNAGASHDTAKTGGRGAARSISLDRILGDEFVSEGARPL